jgi:hypothetical protein
MLTVLGAIQSLRLRIGKILGLDGQIVWTNWTKFLKSGLEDE